MASKATTPQDTAFLLFGQAMPGLDVSTRVGVVDCIRDGDYDVALAVLVRAIDAARIPVEPDLLRDARSFADEVLALL